MKNRVAWATITMLLTGVVVAFVSPWLIWLGFVVMLALAYEPIKASLQPANRPYWYNGVFPLWMTIGFGVVMACIAGFVGDTLKLPVALIVPLAAGVGLYWFMGVADSVYKEAKTQREQQQFEDAQQRFQEAASAEEEACLAELMALSNQLWELGLPALVFNAGICYREEEFNGRTIRAYLQTFFWNDCQQRGKNTAFKVTDRKAIALVRGMVGRALG